MSPGTMKRTSLGSWRLVDFLGAGGMGEVYRGMHSVTGRVAAVKILTATGRTPSVVERFRNEARIQSGLVHPNIVTLYEFFEAEGLPCIAMEYVSGETVDHYIQTRGPIPVGQALAWFSQVVEAVAYVHSRGIVHRDLKTNNIKIDDNGQVRLLDFGIAKSGDSPKLTTDGSVVGTLHYLSPEQVRSSAATPASDIWALGVVFYEIVTGKVPFAADTLTGVMMRILKGTYEPPSTTGIEVPREVERIISRCLRSEPSQRYPSAGDLLSDVKAAMSPAPEARASGPGFLIRPSGEIVTMLRRRGPLLASAGLAVAALFFLVWSLTVCCGPSGDAGRTTQSEPVTPGQESARSTPLSATPDENVTPRPPLRRVIIRVFGEGAAEVIRDGVRVGMTPFEFQARIGEWINITLRRPGHLDRRERFQIVDGVNEYTYSMSPDSPQQSESLAAHHTFLNQLQDAVR
ncbi:MAG: serine/threonine-protein kinase [Gemmatimonadota bacterium]